MVCDAKCKSKVRLDGKTAVITGCNTGIGKETVKDFYRRGARVVMACRNVQKAEEAAKDIRAECEAEETLGQIVLVPLNLSSLKSVRECAGKLLEHEERIDLLVNNAGIMACPEAKTEDGFEMQFGTNHLGHFLFTLLLMPRIIKSAPSRIVNVSSSAHALMSGPFALDDLNWEKREYSTTQAYCQSKLANVLFTKELARKIEEGNIKGVTTYCLHPGAVATDLQRYVGDSISGAVDFVMKHIMRPFWKTPEEGAQTTIYCSVDEKARKETGLYYAECKPKEPSSKAKHLEYARKLWELSLEMVGLDEDYNPFQAILELLETIE